MIDDVTKMPKSIRVAGGKRHRFNTGDRCLLAMLRPELRSKVLNGLRFHLAADVGNTAGFRNPLAAVADQRKTALVAVAMKDKEFSELILRVLRSLAEKRASREG